MSAGTSARSTRERLLEAATQVFLAEGYRDATFRQICRLAGANSAAINYHFRDKEKLYLEVIERVIEESRSRFPLPPDDLPPEQRLRAFVQMLLRNLLQGEIDTPLMKIMAREMADPTLGLDLVVEQVIRPVHAALGEIVRQLAEPGVSTQQVRDCTYSILGQCNCFRHAQPVISRLGQYRDYDPATIEHIIDHIAQFSLAGIRAMKADGAAQSD